MLECIEIHIYILRAYSILSKRQKKYNMNSLKLRKQIEIQKEREARELKRMMRDLEIQKEIVEVDRW